MALCSTTARAEPGDSLPRDTPAAPGDYLFPGALRPSVAIATGSPYVAIADIGVGLGEHAAIGLLAGITPRVAGYGLHPRFALGLNKDWRAILRVPVLYYPQTSDAEQWILTRPSLILEHAFSPDGARVYAGGGVLFTSCIDDLFGGDDDDDMMRALYWTANAGGSLPLARDLDGFIDVATVMTDFHLAGRQWTDFGGPPVIVVLGAALRF
jgi:hypothetical protein